MKRPMQTGSMLIELAASVAVLGLLAAISFGVLQDVTRARQGHAANALANQARELILQFALARGRLPCPDLSGNGGEGDASGNCPDGQRYGLLPTRALGMEGDSAQAAGRQLRYGVFRNAPDADLGSGFGGATKDTDPTTRFLAQAEHAAAYPVATDQPYVPKLDAEGLATNCDAPGDNPAFIVSAGAPEQLGSTACFPTPNPERSASISMGRHELVGWIRSKFRAAN